LISADVVTAAGELLTASATDNSDLFWGLPGGGGNFGVVTPFEYQPARGRRGTRRNSYPSFARVKDVLAFYA
jgi:FAD/FMN-containing dehydrogenase